MYFSLYIRTHVKYIFFVAGCVITSEYNNSNPQFKCQCDRDWKGTFCDVNNKPCPDWPCKHGGVCEIGMQSDNLYVDLLGIWSCDKVKFRKHFIMAQLLYRDTN